MQTTILGLAIALIVALVTALVGPLLIDWGSYRSVFEKEASRLAGLEVRVHGLIDARLLPTPELTLRDIDVSAGEEKVHARSLGVEFALGPLLRGEWRATELRIVGPQLRLGLDSSGRIQTPNADVNFSPEALAIERLTIQDGTLALFDAASDANVTLQKLTFLGEARSLIGPYTGEGTATVNGELYSYRLAIGRYSDGRLKLRINVDPDKQPFSVEAQGTLALVNGRPDFDGTTTLTRPVGIALRGTHAVSQPWRLSGKLKANASSALLQDLAFDYGSPDRGFRLSGVAEFKLGSKPRFDGVLTGRQIDIDRALGEEGGQASPRDAIAKLAQLAGGAFRPTIPIQIGLGIDQVAIGGDTLQNLRGDISTSAQGWNLDRFEFRAPGFTDVRLSGRLSIDNGHPVFNGPIDIKASNPLGLAGWIEGRTISAVAVKPLALQGRLTVAGDRVAVEDLAAEFDRKSVNGRFTYAFASAHQPARLDAAMRASDLDIDAALAFGNSLLAGSPIERPHDITLAVDISRASIAGFTAKDAKAQLKVSSQGLQIDRLSVADLGGAAFSASGRIVTAPPAPQGSLNFDLDAPDMSPILTLLARYAPQTAGVLDREARHMAPAKLHGALTMHGAGFAAEANLAVEGNLGETRIAVDSGIKTDLTTFEPGDVRLHGKFAAENGRALISMLGLDGIVVVTGDRGELILNASGPLRGDWRVSGKIKGGGLDAGVEGTASFLAEKRAARLRAVVGHADAAPLWDGAAALPLTGSANLVLKDDDLSITDVDGTLAGSAVRGQVDIKLTAPHQLTGDVEADYVDAAHLIAAAIGMPRSEDLGWHWSAEPFGSGFFGDYAGSLNLKARRADLLPQFSAQDFSATLKFGKNDLALDDMSGTAANGRLSGSAVFRNAGGVSANVKFTLTDAQADSLAPLQHMVNGKLAIAGEIQGTGLTPRALVGSLRGSGKFTLQDAGFAGLNPAVFDDVAQAVDEGLAIDPGKISQAAVESLTRSGLSIKKAEGDLIVVGGQLRLDKFTAAVDRAGLSIAGNLDLTDGSINGRVVLSGTRTQAGTRPDVFMTLNGSAMAPERSVDVSALSSWLTLRAVERQTKKLQDIERASRTTPTVPAPEIAPVVSPSDVVLPPKRPAPVTHAGEPVSRRQRAPQLPVPVEIGSAPKPGGSRPPAASAVGQ